MTSERYNAQAVRAALESKRPLYEAKWAQGQPEGWIPSPRSMDIWCLSQWLLEMLAGLSTGERIHRLSYFNRKARAEEDLYEIAARVLNNELTGDAHE